MYHFEFLWCLRGIDMLLILLLFLLFSPKNGRIQYYEADPLATEGGDWSVKVIPRIGYKISTITWEFQNRTVIYCKYMGLANGPILSSYYQCPTGCIYEKCQTLDSYGIRIEPTVYRLFAFKATDSMIGDYKLTLTFIGKNHNYSAVSTLVKCSPSLLRLASLNTNIPQISEALKSASAAVLDKQNLAALKDSLKFIREGIHINGSLEVNRGLPEGEMGVYLIRRPRDTHYPQHEPCKLTLDGNFLNFSCLPSVDDFALAILIANSIDPSIANEQALVVLRDWVMKRLVWWHFDMPGTEDSEAPETVFGKDYRVTPLKIGWSAVVAAGEKVEIFCPIDKPTSPEGINCNRSRALDSNSFDTTLPRGFWVEYIEGNKFFYLRKNSSNITDSGVYGCVVNVNGYPKPVCSDRRLYVISNVIPVRTFIHKSVVSEDKLEPKDNFDQFAEEDVPFLMTGQEAYILCWTETGTETTYALQLNMHREYGNSTSDYPFKLIHTYIIREGSYLMRLFKFYRISGEGKVENSGKLKASCSTSYEVLRNTIPEWIIDANDINENAQLGQVSADVRYIYMYHAAEGELRFQGTADKLEDYPVPPGTIIRCSGASGYPEPVYKWTLLDPIQMSSGFVGMSNAANMFIDSPRGLPKSAFQGDSLTIPKDPRYRGMSYLLQCSASNKFAGREFITEKVLFLTICLCESRFVTLDLSLIYSPQLVAGISLVDSDNERSTLDIYGERYVHLMRQIILGLGYGGELVRFSLHPTSVFSRSLKEAPLYASATPFDNHLSRIKLAEGLISQTIRPQAIYASNPKACPQKTPVNLKEGLNSALRHTPHSSRRPFAVIIPQDRWDIGDVNDFMKGIRQGLGKVISVYFENPKSWAKGKPDYAIQLANFSRECQRYSINNRASLISRQRLFDAICAASEPAAIYDETMMVVVFSSHESHQLFEGETITVYVNVRLTPFDQSPVTVWLCLINNEVADYIDRGETDIDYLSEVCAQPLFKASPSQTNPNCITFKLPLTLKDELDNMNLLAYKRSNKEFLSSQEVSILPIRLNRAKFSKPTLKLINPSVKAMDSAEFECEFEMARLKFHVYLIYRPKDKDTYKIITQQKSKDLEYSHRHIGRRVSVKLTWTYFPDEAKDMPIYCVVENTGELEDNLDTLPTLASAPVYRNLSSVCPTRPTIEKISGRPDGKLEEGSRVTFVCEAVTGDGHIHALQMTYVDSKEDLLICSNRGGGKVNTTVPCMFSHLDTGGCRSREKVLTDTHDKGSFAVCEISQHNISGAYLRRIEYSISALKDQHLEAFIFCETIPTWEVEDDSRYLSDPIDLYFPIGPKVMEIKFEYLYWFCDGLAYPQPINTTFFPYKGEPSRFYKWLKAVKLNETFWDSTRYRVLKNSPKGYYPTYKYKVPKETPYRFRLSVEVPYVKQVGTWGEADYICYIVAQNNRTAYEEGHVKYGYGSSSGEWTMSGSIEPTSGVVDPDETWSIRCPIGDKDFKSRNVYVYILGQVQAPSIEPLQVPLLAIRLYRGYNSVIKYVNHTTLGWWAYTREKLVRVYVRHGVQTKQEVMIDVHKASFHDTGKYMCRSFLYEKFTQAHVLPDLVIEPVKQSPIIGYIAANRSWEFADSPSKYLTFHNNEHFTSRCLIWRFQIPQNPFFTKPFIAESTERNLNMVKITKDTVRLTEKEIFQYYIYQTINVSWKLSVKFDYNKHIGCYWNLDTQEERELGQKFGPLKICAPTEKLKSRPDASEPLPRNGVLECYDGGEIYQDLVFTWEYRFGPLPLLNDSVDIRGIPKRVKSARFDMSLLPLPGFYIYQCIGSSFCGGKEMISTKTVQFVVVGDEKSPAFTTVSIFKRAVLLPEKFTVECPSIVSHGSSLTALHLIWFNINHRANTISPHLHKYATILSYHDLINSTVNVSHPHLVAYRSKRSNREIFAIDILQSSFEDYGFYGCTTGALRAVGEIKNLSLSQISADPLCIVDNRSSVEMTTKPYRSDDCFSEGEVLNVNCQATAFQIFCDEEDKPVGSRLVNTYATVRITSENYDKSIPLSLFSFRILEWKPPKKTIQFAPATITISRNHHNAQISCVIEPELLNSSIIDPEEWRRMRTKIIRQDSRKICVFSPASDYIIIPTPPEQVSETKVAFKIDSGDWITCIASGYPPPTVTLDAYPVRKGALAEVMRLGLDGMDQWLDHSRSQPDWPTAPLNNDTGSMMLVLKELNDPPDFTYFGVCRGTNRVNNTDQTTHKGFIFQIRDTRGFAKSLTFNQFLIIAFMMALLIFVLGTFIHEFLVLLHRHRRLKEE